METARKILIAVLRFVLVGDQPVKPHNHDHKHKHDGDGKYRTVADEGRTELHGEQYY